MKHWVLVITQLLKTLVDASLLGIKNHHQQHFSKVNTGKLVIMRLQGSYSELFYLNFFSAPSRAPLRSILLEEKQLKKFQRRLDYLNLYY